MGRKVTTREGRDEALERNGGVGESRRSEKTTSWKRCKADSILCSEGYSPCAAKTSSHFFTFIASHLPARHRDARRLSCAARLLQPSRQPSHPFGITTIVGCHHRCTTTTAAARPVSIECSARYYYLLIYFSAHAWIPSPDRSLSFGTGYLPTSKMAA